MILRCRRRPCRVCTGRGIVAKETFGRVRVSGAVPAHARTLTAVRPPLVTLIKKGSIRHAFQGARCGRYLDPSFSTQNTAPAGPSSIHHDGTAYGRLQ